MVTDTELKEIRHGMTHGKYSWPEVSVIEQLVDTIDNMKEKVEQWQRVASSGEITVVREERDAAREALIQVNTELKKERTSSSQWRQASQAEAAKCTEYIHSNQAFMAQTIDAEKARDAARAEAEQLRTALEAISNLPEREQCMVHSWPHPQDMARAALASGAK